jgi:hypothetical protein
LFVGLLVMEKINVRFGLRWKQTMAVVLGLKSYELNRGEGVADKPRGG